MSDFDFSSPAPVATRLALQSPSLVLFGAGQTAQLQATAQYLDGSSADVTSSAAGTTYSTTDSSVAGVSSEGVVSANQSGRVLITASNEGAIAVVQLSVVTSGDSDGDGMPDDWEIRHGLDPNNPADAYDDPDHDALTSREEYDLGADPTNPDTDHDSLLDGEEVNRYHTNSLLYDSDGDLVGDGLEVLAGSDPVDPQSVNLAGIITGLQVTPDTFTITFNTILGEASRQLAVKATLIDGHVIDATRALYGTTYSSSDLSVATFGGEDGRVYGGSGGNATVIVRNNGFEGSATVTVVDQAPVALAALDLTGIPLSVRVVGDLVLVAAANNQSPRSDGAGLYLVDTKDPSTPHLLSWLPLSVAEDVYVDGTLAYVTTGNSLVAVDISNTVQPKVVDTISIDSYATGMAAGPNMLYIANSQGSDSALQIVDISVPGHPQVVGSIALPRPVRKVAVFGGLIMAGGSSGDWLLLDASNPTAPRVVADVPSTSQAIALRDRRAFDGNASSAAFSAYDLSLPDNPIPLGAAPGLHYLKDLALADRFAVGADRNFPNSASIFDVSSAVPGAATVLSFGGSYYPWAIGERGGVVFVGAWPSLGGPFQTGGRLEVGRYLSMADDAGISPTVSITAPIKSSPVPERHWTVAEIDAKDDVAVRSVELFRDGISMGKAYVAPFRVRFPVPSADAITLTAVAEDYGGNRTISEAVVVPIQRSTRPIVSLLAPTPGTVGIQRTSLLIAADASDLEPNATVSFWVDQQRIATFTSPPYRFSYVIPASSADFAVHAVLSDTTFGETSTDPVTVHVRAAQPPLVAIAYPTDTTTERIPGSTVPVLVAAKGDVDLTGVTLFVNGAPQTATDQAPYYFEVTVPAGVSVMTLHAVAHDAFGQQGDSGDLMLPIAQGGDSTTAVGTVVDTSHSPAAGVTVTCAGRNGATNASGDFAIGGVPGDLAARGESQRTGIVDRPYHSGDTTH